MCVLLLLASWVWDIHIPTFFWVVAYIIDMAYSREQGRKEVRDGRA